METLLLVSSVLLWIVVMLNLLLTLALVRRINSTQPQQGSGKLKVGPEVGKPAPHFVAETTEGEPVTLATHAGRALVLIFISSHCKPCREALPGYLDLANSAIQAGTQFVLVTGDSMEEARKLNDEFQIHIPMLVAPRKSNTFLDDYAINSTPSYCFVNQQGIVAAAGYPSLEWGEWKALVTSWKGKKRERVEV